MTERKPGARQPRNLRVPPQTLNTPAANLRGDAMSGELQPIIREAVDRWYSSHSAMYARSTDDWRNGLTGYIASAVDAYVAALTEPTP